MLGGLAPLLEQVAPTIAIAVQGPLARTPAAGGPK